MEIDIIAELKEINFGATGMEEIMQNIRTILTTLKGSVPLSREFGFPSEHIDKPLPIAKAKMTATVIEILEKYEPRCKVIKVFFNGDAIDGILISKVRVKIDEQYL